MTKNKKYIGDVLMPKLVIEVEKPTISDEIKYEVVVGVVVDLHYSNNEQDGYILLHTNNGNCMQVLFSTIKYVAFLDGSHIYKGYCDYLIPIFENASLESKLKRINKLLAKVGK